MALKWGLLGGSLPKYFLQSGRDHVRRGNYPARSDGTPTIWSGTPDLNAFHSFGSERAIGPRAPVGPEGVALKRFPDFAMQRHWIHPSTSHRFQKVGTEGFDQLFGRVLTLQLLPC